MKIKPLLFYLTFPGRLWFDAVFEDELDSLLCRGPAEEVKLEQFHAPFVGPLAGEGLQHDPGNEGKINLQRGSSLGLGKKWRVPKMHLSQRKNSSMAQRRR